MNLAQGTTRTFDTREDGSFSFTTLEAASYKLAVAAPSGFTPYEQHVTVNVGQVLNVPVRLEIATSQTKIEIVADTPAGVDTTTSALGGVINARQISTLRLNGRNYLELSLLVPGNAPAPNFDPTKENTVVISTPRQVGCGGNVTIDGADNNDDAVGGSLVNIPEDAVQEFQIATNRFSAELGRSGSAVTNVVTKQGTNNIHGGVAMYERDKVLQGLPATYDPASAQLRPFTASNTPGTSAARSGRTRHGGSLLWRTASSSARTWSACATLLPRRSAGPLPPRRRTTISRPRALTGR